MRSLYPQQQNIHASIPSITQNTILDTIEAAGLRTANLRTEDMCNGSSTRVAQGGSIAVIRPVPTRAAHDNQPQIHGSFYFRDGSGVGTTDAIFEADDESSRRAIDGCICVIQ